MLLRAGGEMGAQHPEAAARLWHLAGRVPNTHTLGAAAGNVAVEVHWRTCWLHPELLARDVA